MTTFPSIGKLAFLSGCALTAAIAAGFKDSGLSNVTLYQSKAAQVDSMLSHSQAISVVISNNIGTAIINQNGYLIEVAFDYDLVDDSNGALGHSDVTIDITSLQINSVTNTTTGKRYKDWTNANDHQQIIAQIRSYVNQNRLVEV